MSGIACDVCGYPLDEDGSCWNCDSKAFHDGSSPIPPTISRRDMERIVEGPVGNEWKVPRAATSGQEDERPHLDRQACVRIAARRALGMEVDGLLVKSVLKRSR